MKDEIIPEDDFMTPLLVSEKDAARMLQMPVKTLQKWRVTGRGPKFVKLGVKFIRYSVDELRIWIDQNNYSSTSEYRAKN